MSLNVHRKSNLIILIMKKSILNLGKSLNKAEQKTITGSFGPCGKCGIMTPRGCFYPNIHPNPDCNR